MMESIVRTYLEEHYALASVHVQRMSTGVGGDTFRIGSDHGPFVFKIVKADEINHPEQETALCRFLRDHGIPASEFIADENGHLLHCWHDGRICHLQRMIQGSHFVMNTAPEWFMNESPRLLARIHHVLEGYPRLPEGIGTGFFQHLTPEVVLRSYHSSLTLARERREEDVCEEINARIRIAEKHLNWRIDPTLLTHVNSHGDFTVNQILCDNDRITGVIDWTSACVHPVVWELTRSYFYASPDCANGCWSESGLRAYISAYDAVRPLTANDRAAILDVYLYQLLVCDYYAQYLHASAHEAGEFRQQADFATSVLRHSFE